MAMEELTNHWKDKSIGFHLRLIQLLWNYTQIVLK